MVLVMLHMVIELSVSWMKKFELQKLYGNHSVRESQIDVKTRRNFVRLIGEKPMVKCCLDGVKFEMLWDTGCMITLVDSTWVKQNFPVKKIYYIKEFLHNEVLQVRAANSTEINFDGVLLFDFKLNDNLQTITVPFLVSSEDISEPILGYNVIGHLVFKQNGKIENFLNSTFVSKYSDDKIAQLVALIQEKAEDFGFIDKVKVSTTMVIPAGCCSSIKVKVKILMDESEKSVYFIPDISANSDDLSFSETISTVKRGGTQNIYIDVINPSRNDILLKKGAVIGNLCSVSAVFPMKLETFVPKNEIISSNVDVSTCENIESELNLKNLSEEKNIYTDSVEVLSGMEKSKKWIPKVDLSHLPEEKRKLVENLLYDECNVFSKSDNDIGDIEDFQMKINLLDESPVREAYRHLPRNLYEEVRNYVNDLLINGWIRVLLSICEPYCLCKKKRQYLAYVHRLS